MNLITLSIVTGIVLAVEALLLMVLFVHLLERVSAHLTARRLLRHAELRWEAAREKAR